MAVDPLLPPPLPVPPIVPVPAIPPPTPIGIIPGGRKGLPPGTAGCVTTGAACVVVDGVVEGVVAAVMGAVTGGNVIGFAAATVVVITG